MKITRKRHVLLLEVLIAIAIMTLCILPLVHPHIFILQEEKHFVREVELDRFVGVLYSELLVEEFYRQKIQWYPITEKQAFDVSDERLKKLGFKGKYHFELLKRKSQVDEDVYLYNLVRVHYTFSPLEGGDPVKYHYDLFVNRASHE